MAKLKIGVVMDPVDKINIDKDTTFVLMLEAQRRGHEIYFMELDDMFIRAGTVHSRYRQLTQADPDAAATLLEQAQEAVKSRRKMYLHMAEQG